jgi:hypothetical protein
MCAQDVEDDSAELLARRVLMRLRWARGPWTGYCYRLELAQQAELLIAVDAVLQLHPAWDTGMASGDFSEVVADLDDILANSGSLYRVDFNQRCLVRRVESTVQAAVDSAISTATPKVADHLRTAWVAAYGLQPDQDKAYDQAILALEELICPLVCPRNNRATLGVAISDLRNQAARWELNIEDTGTGQPAGIESVIRMLDLLWKGQSRHGGNPNSRQQTQAEAEAAVHMAAALTQWLTTGLLRRKP